MIFFSSFFPSGQISSKTLTRPFIYPTSFFKNLTNSAIRTASSLLFFCSIRRMFSTFSFFIFSISFTCDSSIASLSVSILEIIFSFSTTVFSNSEILSCNSLIVTDCSKILSFSSFFSECHKASLFFLSSLNCFCSSTNFVLQ